MTLTIHLCSSEARKEAERILDQDASCAPAAVNDLEVLSWLSHLADERGIELRAIRLSDGVEYSTDEIKAALKHQMDVR